MERKAKDLRSKVTDQLGLDQKDAIADLRGSSEINRKYMRVFFAQHCPTGLFVTLLKQLDSATKRECH